MDYLDDLQKSQHIAEETVEYLRSLKDQKISTGKIEKAVVEALRKAGVLTRLEAHEQKIVEHDGTLSELGESILKGFGQIIAAGRKFTIKK